ncbi:Tubulin-tyrosine ligase/Tubulin polyglutamylase [Cinara cedri]|uniref:Tubulin-tyrosine ligase/Tubulin polyglutamylase n=1 Tax=Cinara cedri TaxID=506608 RepID=A0A5E4NQD9_9HEMI|nr:Tubulin-tyrosine ligase/Tubulin polyglutamylase [Cinara cedri]
MKTNAYYRGSSVGKYTVGTVDQAIKDKKIFSEKAKMPAEVRKVLLDHGWISKHPLDGGAINKDSVFSLHKNHERVKTVVKRYDSGLIWMDSQRCEVNWLTLHPSIIINRFPRDESGPLKLCELMPGNAAFNNYYPRAYMITAVNDIVEDYSLTACASLVRAFIDGYENEKILNSPNNSKDIQKALHFAIHNCYKLVNSTYGDQTFSGKGPEWESFFKYYYQITHKNQKFLISMDVKDLNSIKKFSKLLIAKLEILRPQTAMDGHCNTWILKSNKPSILLNEFDEILKMCEKIKSEGATNNCIIQKFIETPLLSKNLKFDLQTWILISTLDNCVTIWLYQMCCMQFGSKKFNLNIEKSKPIQYENSNIHIHTCNLKKIKSLLRSMGMIETNDVPLYITLKKNIVSSVVATVDVLNLRPNSFELFQATFVLGSDLKPWLIKIRPDPCLTTSLYNYKMSTFMSGIATSLAKIIIKKNLACKANIGLFDLVHTSSITDNQYKPRMFIDRPIYNHGVKIRSQKKIHTYKQLSLCQHHNIDDSNIKTYVESIKDEDIYIPMRTDVLSDTFTKKLNMELKHWKDRLNSGSKIDVHVAKYYLSLLDQWKTRFRAAQHFFKSPIQFQNNLIKS